MIFKKENLMKNIEIIHLLIFRIRTVISIMIAPYIHLKKFSIK